MAGVLKPPVWTWEVPLYFFVGGTAGASALIAGVGSLAGATPDVLNGARWIAAIGALVSPALLVSDLGRPARFLNMLRVLKWQSPMSVGAWTLAIFSPAAVAAVGLRVVLPEVPTLAMIADLIAACFGAILSTYTGVLIGATAIPVWSRYASTLPLHFGATALGVAASILELVGHREPALNRLGLASAVVETVLLAPLELSRDRVARSLFDGPSGLLVRVGAWLTGPVPLVCRLVPGLRLVASVSMTAGSLVARFGWIAVGRRSAIAAEAAKS